MPKALYNCKTDGDEYRITKFTPDLEVEASYLTDGIECECPAGARATCRHRQMLHRFIAKRATSGQFFHDFEANVWVRAITEDEEFASAASEVTGPDAMIDMPDETFEPPLGTYGLAAAGGSAERGPEAEAWGTILGENVVAVHNNVPIIEIPAINILDLAQPSIVHRAIAEALGESVGPESDFAEAMRQTPVYLTPSQYKAAMEAKMDMSRFEISKPILTDPQPSTKLIRRL